MANFVIQDPAHPVVPGLVTQHSRSQGAIAEWQAKPGAIMDPPGFEVAEEGNSKWDGAQVVPLTPAEQAALDAANAATNLAATKADLIAALQDTGIPLYHVLHAMAEELHAHVASPTKTVNQLKNAIANNATARINALS